jgi:hypothetical protein
MPTLVVGMLRILGNTLMPTTSVGMAPLFLLVPTQGAWEHNLGTLRRPMLTVRIQRWLALLRRGSVGELRSHAGAWERVNTLMPTTSVGMAP